MARGRGAAPIRQVEPGDVATRSAVEHLLGTAATATDHPALAEASLLTWAADEGHVALVAEDADAVIGYAQVGWRDASASVEIVVDPEQPDAEAVRSELLDAAVASAREGGADELRYWVTQHHDDLGGEATALGFAAERDLLQLRVDLPVGGERLPFEPGFSFRTFRPGHDEQAWLEVNNRAFARHPEQGHWELDTLLAREATPWFDPDGFFLCEAGDGRLAGSNWTKVHADLTPTVGEIYVISVDPDFQGLGLGRALALTGLDWLAARAPTGMLYVDASNTGAVELYRTLGFHEDHVDRCYLLRLG